MRVRCPAKINLDLRVGPPRADGFHPIRSWFVTAGIYDALTFTDAADLSLTCDDPAVPVDGRNLVWRAAEALRNAAGAAGRGVAIRLQKQIPAGAGLGGGSSDAAHTLLALNTLWGLGLDTDRLASISATLGSDVPFFLAAPSAICEGRGELITPIAPPAAAWAVLVLPPIAMPTPEVFRRFDTLGGGSDFPPPLAGGGRGRGFEQAKVLSQREPLPPPPPAGGGGAEVALTLLSRLVNDLESAAFDLRPDLGDLRAAAERLWGRPVRMSGSGSSLFTLFDGQTPAIAAAAAAGAGLGVPCRAVALGVHARGIAPDDPPGEADEPDRN